MRFNLLELRDHLAVLRRTGKLPVDRAHRPLRIGKAGLPEVVLIVETELDRLEAFFFRHGLQLLFELRDFARGSLLVAFKVRPLLEAELGQYRRDALVTQALIDFIEEAEI